MTSEEKIRKLIISEDRFKELLIAEKEYQFILDNELEHRIDGINKKEDEIKYSELSKEIEKINNTNYFDKEIE